MKLWKKPTKAVIYPFSSHNMKLTKQKTKLKTFYCILQPSKIQNQSTSKFVNKETPKPENKSDALRWYFIVVSKGPNTQMWFKHMLMGTSNSSNFWFSLFKKERGLWRRYQLWKQRAISIDCIASFSRIFPVTTTTVEMWQLHTTATPIKPTG